MRGPGVRELDLALPPARMPLVHRGRPLKRWRYVGVFGPELMLCAGDARVAGLPRRWWAVAESDGTLRERSSTRRGGVRQAGARVRVGGAGERAEHELGEGAAVEVVSRSGGAYAWTRKRLVPARGRVGLDGREVAIEAEALVDDSAGYHERRTTWRWSAGVGRRVAGERVAWNVVSGVHDAPAASERTLWVELRFRAWAAREEHTNLLLFRSDYRQPFGAFVGVLPGGLELAEGFGVMEEHEARW